MSNVIVAKLTELLQFHSIGIRLLILIRDVISLFAVRTSKRNSYAHDATSHRNINEASIVSNQENIANLGLPELL
jgi:hypothetical protein